MAIKHEIHLIDHEGDLYVQRPTSWMGGWARHLLMRRYVPRKVSIASPDFWETISLDRTALRLVVYDDGTFALE